MHDVYFTEVTESTLSAPPHRLSGQRAIEAELRSIVRNGSDGAVTST